MDPPVERTALGHLEVVERLLAAKAEVNSEAAQPSGRTALEGAAEQGHVEVVERLLAAKAEVNAKALEAAAYDGGKRILKILKSGY